MSSNSCCLFADTLAAGLEIEGSVFTMGTVSVTDGDVSALEDSSSFGAGAGRFGGALAKADIIFPEAVRFIVVVDAFVCSGRLLLDTY
jgi:hypothetical protein